MSAACPQCGSSLPSGAKACGHCGTAVSTKRRADEPGYGLLDLDGPTGSLALDVAADPRPRKNRTVGGGPDSAPIGAAPQSSSTLTSRTARTSSGSSTGRMPAVAKPGASTPGATRSPAPAVSASKNATLGAGPPKSPTTGTSRSMAKMPGTIAGAPAFATGQTSASTGSTITGHRAASGPNEGATWGGTMIGDDPLDDTFAQNAAAPALEIDEEADPRRRRQAEEEPAPRELTASEKRALEIARLAAYGPPPANIAGTMGYWVRVTLRKRALDEELAALSAHRKRADDAARDAVAKLGESLHGRRRDPRLATLAKQLEAVSSSEAAIGSVEKAGAQRKENIRRERVQIEGEVKAIESDAAPLREREIELEEQIAEHKANAKRADMQSRRLAQEIEALRKKPNADPELYAQLRAEREAAHGEMQTLGIQLGPLEDELAVVQDELSIHLSKLSALQQGQQAATTALERAQQTHRVTSGSARGARRDALSALAQFAIDNGLAALVPAELKAVQEAAERRDQKRAEEELLRAATRSFNETAYKQGMMLLVGGTGLLFLSLILVVIF